MDEHDPFPALATHKESPAQAALHAWFSAQRLQSVDNLEAAARQIIGLCTTLLGLLLALLALAETPLPAYMRWSGVPWLGGAGALALLAALLCALSVVLPRPTAVLPNAPADQQAAFEALLARKRRGLWWAVVAFGLAMLCLAALIVVALAIVA